MLSGSVDSGARKLDGKGERCMRSFPLFFPFLSFATIFHLRNVASLSTVPPRLDATVPPRVQEGIILQPASRQD